MADTSTPLYLQDRIVLRTRVVLRANDVRTLRSTFGLPDTAMAWSFTRNEQVWDPTSEALSSTPREMAHYEGDEVFAAFVDLARIGMPIMEKLSAGFGESSSWRLRFAGVLMLDPFPSNAEVMHLWQIPSYDSLWRMMDALREQLWYILLQGFVDSEHQNLLRDATLPGAMFPYDESADVHSYLVASQRISPIEYLSIYGDVGDYIDLYMKQAGAGIKLRGTITTGTLGAMHRIYAASTDSVQAMVQASAEMRLLFDALRLAKHEADEMPAKLQQMLAQIPDTVNRFWPFVVENQADFFLRLKYDHPEPWKGGS